MLRLLAVPLLVFACADPSRAASLRAGLAEVDVTPTVGGGKPVFLAGYGHDRKATKVHDPIMARAVVLDDGAKKIALVSVDVVGLFFATAEAVRKELPSCHYVLVSSTHNHEGPDTLGLWGSSPFSSGIDPAYMKKLEAGVVKAVKDAESALAPVTVKIGSAACPDLLDDSRQPIVKHADIVTIEFTRAESKKRHGVLVQWNCHPEALGSKNTEVSADYVASTVKHLRQSQSCPVVYFTGTVGGLLAPAKGPLETPDGQVYADNTFGKTEEFGRRVALEAEKALKAGAPATLAPFEVRTRAVHVPVDNRVYQLGWSLGVLKRTMYVWDGDPYPKHPVEGKDAAKRSALRTEVGYLKLGELEVAVIPGEIYPELVLGKVQDPADPAADFPDAPVEPSIWARLKGKYKMIVGLGNDEIGYIIPKRQWDEKPPFCYGLKKAQYGEINSTGPETAPILCQAFAELVTGK